MAGVLSDLVNGAKQLQKINKDLGDVEFKEQILQQRELLIAVQSELLDLREQLSAATQEIEVLKSAALFEAELVEHKGYKFEVIEGKPVGRPFCPVCLTNKKGGFKLVKPPMAKDEARGTMQCPNCKHKYGYPVPVFPEIDA